MTFQVAITLGITIAGFISGIVWKVADLSVKFGRLTKQLETNEERDSEERRRNAAKFTELYNSRNAQQETIMRLDTTMNNINGKLEKIDSKIDRLIERGTNDRN